jgi:chromosome segregation ATPase
MPPKKRSGRARKSVGTKIERLLQHDDMPATVGLVNEVRSEVIAEIRSVHHQLDGKISHLDGKISQLDGKISHLDGKISQLDGKISHLDGKIYHLDGRVSQVEGKVEQVLAVVHRTQALMEEQRGENKIVLDGLKSVMERQDRAEGEAKESREILQILVKAKLA